MCDTVVATGETTASGRVLFAKNSDREPSEAQAVELLPRSAGGLTRATYLAVAGSEPRQSTLLCRPHWMWGAEMGVGASGLAIGNEAVFTRVHRPELGLLGMDLVRLALERARSAPEALETIAELLETYGQGGPAGHRDKRFSYDSSFLIADPEQAWVLETAGRAWVAQRVRGVRAISNALTLRDDWDRACSGLAARARDAGLDPGRGRVDFARTFGRPALAIAAAAAERRACTEAYLRARAGSIGVLDAMAALRQHGKRPGKGAFMSVCAHASWWPTRRAGQTTGSLVTALGSAPELAWVTATAAPCTSVFKPVWLDAAPDFGPTPRDRHDERARWWRHERLHRRALADLGAFTARFAPERDALEAELVAGAAALDGATPAERRAFSQSALERADELEDRHATELGARPIPGALDRRFWRALDRRSGLSA
jgi:dipeptidase